MYLCCYNKQIQRTGISYYCGQIIGIIQLFNLPYTRLFLSRSTTNYQIWTSTSR